MEANADNQLRFELEKRVLWLTEELDRFQTSYQIEKEEQERLQDELDQLRAREEGRGARSAADREGAAEDEPGPAALRRFGELLLTADMPAPAAVHASTTAEPPPQPPPQVEVDMPGEGVRVYHFASEDDRNTAVLFIVNPALES